MLGTILWARRSIIPRALLRPQVMESLNQNLAAIFSWCLKRHMKLNPKKTKFMAVSRSRKYAPGYGDSTLDGAELEKLRSLLILGVAFDSKLTFETHLREVMSKAARCLGRGGKLFGCPRVLKSYLVVF